MASPPVDDVRRRLKVSNLQGHDPHIVDVVSLPWLSLRLFEKRFETANNAGEGNFGGSQF